MVVMALTSLRSAHQDGLRSISSVPPYQRHSRASRKLRVSSPITWVTDTSSFSVLAAHNETKAAAIAAQAAAAIAATAKKPAGGAAAAAAKKKQKQGSRAVEALKKVDTRSMMKMTSFFKKKEPNASVQGKEMTGPVGDS